MILGSISLDLFVVLLGGATALLPIYARDILQTGRGLGLLALGAGDAVRWRCRWCWRALRSRRIGSLLFGAVIVFGLATVVFGVSTSLPLSLAALVVLGASNVISVVIRHSLVQIRTPDAMRGRVTRGQLAVHRHLEPAWRLRVRGDGGLASGRSRPC